MADIGLVEMLILQGIVLLAAVSGSMLSFGFGMVSMPFLLIWLDPVQSVEINLVLTGVLFGLISLQTWRHVERSTLFSLVSGAVLGASLGTYVSATIPDFALRFIFTSAILITALLGVAGQLKYISREAVAGVPVGICYGFLNAGMALGGPVVALFALNQQWARDTTRAMLSSFFLITCVLGLAFHAIGGLLSYQDLLAGMIFIPSLTAGVFVGVRLVGHVDETLFRRLILLVMIATSLGVFIREIIRIL
ncbi:sulfite exporter TauE/SafE family protein [SAR202 cluster bacterium AD-804-J14_MRT_500m]|nr:sulfite exporter TauE/SafE family protein [SAR202 cluster bacterium AD-804-J14_MRT_500m]